MGVGAHGMMSSRPGGMVGGQELSRCERRWNAVERAGGAGRRGMQGRHGPLPEPQGSSTVRPEPPGRQHGWI